MPFAQHDFLAWDEPHAAFSVEHEDFFDILFFFFFFFLSSFLSSIVVSEPDAYTGLLTAPTRNISDRVKNSFFMINSLEFKYMKIQERNPIVLSFA